ncbi:HepT-like ribonuclease domain-containing protein [Salinarimonas rosea]|uniref:HepT-like ribonuclease domain-containing protein n=1 Tax=Salinarimonas rosea TaxID=552063 RepID=UPI0006939D3C|nr:HepT-like ribonuclease domain-containing protein [Salinarimonas rosea]
MLEAIDHIDEACRGKSLADLEADWVLARAIERGLEIVSEASRHLPDSEKAQHADIPWRAVHSIGNVLRHEYHRISRRIIWNVATVDLPKLAVALRSIERRRDLSGSSE